MVLIIGVCVFNGSGCDYEQKVAKRHPEVVGEPLLTGRRVRIETRISARPAVISGDYLLSEGDSSGELSTLMIQGNVTLEMVPFGSISCQRLALTRDQRRLECDGNVRGLLMVSTDTKPEGGTR